MAAPLQDMFDFVKKSQVATKYDIDVNSSGGDTLCFVKKLPYVEDRYEAVQNPCSGLHCHPLSKPICLRLANLTPRLAL